MARRHATDGSGPSVSRFAYFGGLGAGISAAVGGYYLVPYLNYGTLGTALIELGTVVMAIFVTKTVWKFSDWRHQLDRDVVPQDGKYR